MSTEATAWALAQPVHRTFKLVLIGIASHADREGRNAWPTLAALSLYANVHPRSVSRAVRWLECRGYLIREVNAGGVRNTVDWERPNLYHLCMGVNG